MLIVATRYLGTSSTTVVMTEGDSRIETQVPEFLLKKAEAYVGALVRADNSKILGILVDASPEPMLSVFVVTNGSVQQGVHFFGRQITSEATIEKRKLREFLGTRSLNADVIERVISKL
jgi:hypothetical protein